MSVPSDGPNRFGSIVAPAKPGMASSVLGGTTTLLSLLFIKQIGRVIGAADRMDDQVHACWY